MTIRNQISGQFSFIVASILTVFSLTVYIISADFREEEFYDRLKQQARTTARLLIEVQEVDIPLLKIIDQNKVSALVNEQVLVFDQTDQLVYSSIDDTLTHYQPEWLAQIREEGEWESHTGDAELIGLVIRQGDKAYTVMASAYDQFGRSKLRYLAFTLFWGWLAGIGVTVVLGFFFAGRSLRPIARINQQIQTITAQDLRQRLDEGRRQDEIDQLAVNFNQVLARLELAFEQQRSFVSHASHELRTPLATLKSDVQLALRRTRSADELRAVLQTMLPDIDRLSALTNSLLMLARTLENGSSMLISTVRIDEVVFAAQEELLQAYPTYQVDVQYLRLPEAEADTEVLGNESLLKRVVYNLLDNACKYSADHRAEVQISYDQRRVQLAVRDEGIGIPPEEEERIFDLFYRTDQSRNYEGFGIGLSICRRIIELHQGRLTLQSTPGLGSTFTVQLPRQL
ncbi:HAMP domain-containing protein [Rudanella paleaurantiibacter]|uniref:histidine kinase n=1 Tax=Rudanella paleaurantiibacter TaxID=2614655 RepID=A0A7J5U193_9BACT|nr:HAMP domain-containing sensor histidine kinase [Rudanella paleaurantiibacter]KAB7731574.1 HAMP domain-containing protein [Rudanella paleaurantiibacter]